MSRSISFRTMSFTAPSGGTTSSFMAYFAFIPKSNTLFLEVAVLAEIVGQ
jgi:hypothetical protein